MSNSTFGIQLITQSNDHRSKLIYGTAEFLASSLQQSLDDDDISLTNDDYVIVILETDSQGNELSQFSTKPLLTVPNFITVMTKESQQ